MKTFSERKGLTPVSEIIQTNSMNEALRNSLWNVLDDLPPKAVPSRVLVQAPPFGWGVVQEAEVG